MTGAKGRSLRHILLVVEWLLIAHGALVAAELRPETLQAWNEVIAAEEVRIAAEIAMPGKFLALDFQDARTAAEERRDLLAGDVVVRQMPLKRMGNRPAGVPGGTVQHWRGAVFVPDVTLDFVMSLMEDPERDQIRQEDVLEMRVLEKTPTYLRLFLKLQRSHLVTAVYNTEHLVRFRRHDDATASSSNVATRISEVERLGDGRERERLEGQDRGFLWRMNSYWRYQQVHGGVLVECESMTLSRSIPGLIEPVARPVIKKIARESMARTLDTVRSRLVRAAARQVRSAH